jgi:hypothetical protein
VSAYEWPAGGAEESDDAVGRQRYQARRPDRSPSFDLRSALERSRRRPSVAADDPDIAAGQATGRTDRWIPIGPATLTQGITSGRQRATGRVRDLWVSPDGLRLYAGSGQGGVWYSGDGGASWRSVGGMADSDKDIDRPAHRFSIGALLVIPDGSNDPAGDTVYVGTGELRDFTVSRPGHEVGGVGVLVATGPATFDPHDDTTDPNEVDPWDIEANDLLQGRGVYRLCRDEATGVIYAATTRGLLRRRVDGTEAVPDPWEEIDVAPFAGSTEPCTDVIWTAGDIHGAPDRLWVWISAGEDAGLWCRDGTSGPFTRTIPAPKSFYRACLAASKPPLTTSEPARVIYALRDRGPYGGAPDLHRITAAGTVPPVPAGILGVPEIVDRQGYYDLALAVDPNDPDRVVLGGQVAYAGGAIYTGRVEADGSGALRFGGTAGPQYIGGGCHGDVHALRFAVDGTELWAASDGGVARSTNPTAPVGFVSRNDGLPAVESNFVACHPICEGWALAGLQDNGTIERWSSTVWETLSQNDGGGVAFDPARPTRYVAQASRIEWWSNEESDDFERWGQSLGFGEQITSAFYSNPAVIGHTNPARDSQLLILTNRVWYTEDWGSTWVTLPTAESPLPAANDDPGQDQLLERRPTEANSEELVACAWASPDVAWILSNYVLWRMWRIPGSWSSAKPGVWDKEIAGELSRGKKTLKRGEDDELIRVEHWSVLAPDPSIPPVPADPDPEDPDAPAFSVHGAVYVGGLGLAGDPTADTLWWYDGLGTWYPTGLREAFDGTSAPVTAIVCDPTPTANGPRVFVGTGVGVWQGTRIHDSPPEWSWSSLINGLPESTVEDLALFSSADPSREGSEVLTLLRAAVAARGLWEVRLDKDIEDLTYLRAHVDDLRYRDRAIGVGRDGTSPRSWHASPDIVVRNAPLALPPPPGLAEEPWWAGTSLSAVDRQRLQRFQAALRARMIRTSGDDRVEADGNWDDLFNEALRDHPGAEGTDGTVTLTEAIWEEVVQPPDDTAEPWGEGSPSEADLYDRTISGDVELRWDQASLNLDRNPKKVDVVVHHRGDLDRKGEEVRVTVLRWTRTAEQRIPRANDSSTWFTGEVPWTGAVNEVLNSADGTTTIPLTDGWSLVDAANPRRDLTGQHLDNLTSGIATFDLDLTNHLPGTVMILVAVMRAATDIGLQPATLEELAMTRPEVAVRSLALSSGPGLLGLPPVVS